MNRNTVAKAYTELESQGVIETAAGKGCFVRNTGTPLKKKACLTLLAEEVDQAVVQAHHLQVTRADSSSWSRNAWILSRNNATAR